MIRSCVFALSTKFCYFKLLKHSEIIYAKNIILLLFVTLALFVFHVIYIQIKNHLFPEKKSGETSSADNEPDAPENNPADTLVSETPVSEE